jgi:hypothetical protein
MEVTAVDQDPNVRPRAIGTGVLQGYAVLGDGHVMSWGSNAFSELGRSAPNPTSTPGTVTGLDSTWNVSGGNGYGIAVSRGAGMGWGISGGPTGMPSAASTPTATFIYPIFTDLAAGYSTSYGRFLAGTVVSSGIATSGALGNGTLTNASGWTYVSAINHVWLIAAGQEFGMALAP